MIKNLYNCENEYVKITKQTFYLLLFLVFLFVVALSLSSTFCLNSVAIYFFSISALLLFSLNLFTIIFTLQGILLILLVSAIIVGLFLVIGLQLINLLLIIILIFFWKLTVVLEHIIFLLQSSYFANKFLIL